MPIYEYQCPKCGVFERTQRISDGPLRRCPDCRRKVSKLISTTSFQLKGSGWYVTDYARKEAENKKPAGESSKPADGSSKPADGSSSSSGNGSSGSGTSGKDSKSSATSSTS